MAGYTSGRIGGSNEDPDQASKEDREQWERSLEDGKSCLAVEFFG